ncbi:hypothetical protein D3C76_168380 [compost metagenome]
MDGTIDLDLDIHLLDLDFLIYYHGYSLLMLGLAHKDIEKYDEARACIKAYSDLIL